MRDISEFPMSELIFDLKESCKGLVAANVAKAIGITTYGDGASVQERLDGEQGIIDIILKEILRRGEE